MDNLISYKTSSPAGDLISFLAGFRQVYRDTGKKALVYQRLNVPGMSYEGSAHPFKDDQGLPVTMNRYMFDMLYPLLKSQEYIEDFLEYKGEEITFDMDKIRMERFTNQPNGSLNRWPFYVFPDLTCDLSQKWLLFEKGIKDRYKDFVVINFTLRHRNYWPTYYFLKPFQERLIFAGLKEERDIFCKTWDLDIPHLQVDNFLELAKTINGCKFFLGNASMCFQIAEATKCKRILETFPVHPNIIPIGEHAHDYYHQQHLEFCFHKLISLP